MHIINALKNIIKYNPVLFTTPGHSQDNRVISRDFEKLSKKNIFKMDFSEIQGLDNLHTPSGVILESQTKTSSIYQSLSSYYLVNGSSSGIIALMLVTATKGDKVLIARNVHKSVINALVLSGATPVWVNTEWDSKWNIPAQLNYEKVREIIDKTPNIKAVWLTNPTYEGIVTDISQIANLCKQKGIVLIVDEAHGALWNFSGELPVSAIHLGADASIQSLHKTGSCLTQGAILHLGYSSKIDSERLQQCLNIINTTSPSYPILCSIESSIEYLDSFCGRKKIDILLENIDKFRKKLKKYGVEFLEKTSNYDIDKTKLFFGLKELSGNELADILEENHKIEVELSNNMGILALTGIGTDRKKLDKLLYAIDKIRRNVSHNKTEKNIQTTLITPEVILTPREAFYKKSMEVDIEDSIYKVSKNTILSYPPGIPILIAGEIIQNEHLKQLSNMTKIEIITK